MKDNYNIGFLSLEDENFGSKNRFEDAEISEAIFMKVKGDPREKSQKIERYKDWYNFFEQQLNYIKREPKQLSASLVQIPEREEIPILVEDHLVVEFMAR